MELEGKRVNFSIIFCPGCEVELLLRVKKVKVAEKHAIEEKCNKLLKRKKKKKEMIKYDSFQSVTHVAKLWLQTSSTEYCCLPTPLLPRTTTLFVLKLC